jgi:lipopolysaccharide transport system ATP-binding protein
VQKKFCRSLKKSLWYGVQDICSELNPFVSQKSEVRDRISANGSQKSDLTSDLRPPTSSLSSVLCPPTSDLRSDEFWAVNDVSFELRRGECLGLIGHNGAGKTTLLKMLNGLIKPDAGRIEMRGRIGALISLGAGFNPILTGRENIYVNGSVLGLTKREIDAKIDEIIDFADIREFIDTPVQSYSSGMQVRLGFSIATSVEPDVLLLDEVLAVGDVAFRIKCYERIGRLLKKAAVILVSHNMAQIPRLCNRILYAERGHATLFSSVPEGINAYLIPQSSSSGFRGNEPEFLLPGLTSARLSVTPSETFTFDRVRVIVTIEASQHFKVGLIVGNFVTADGREGAEFRAAPALDTGGIARGINRLTVEIPVIPFSSGVYMLNLAIFDETRKATLVHFAEACKLTITGAHISNFPNLLNASYVSTIAQ